MIWPPVTILIVTYDRPAEIRATILALQHHVKYDGKLRWHLADDGSPGSYVLDIQHNFSPLGFHRTVTDRRGWGANVNVAMKAISTDYIFLCEDDYVAVRDLNLNQGVALLESQPEIGLVRYDGISAHKGLVLRLDELKHPAAGRFDYLTIDAVTSSHLNVYSNRPHLKHRRFHKKYGIYAEGIKLGETESAFAHTVKDRPNGPQVAILADGIETAFRHVGKSRQGTKYDRGT